MKKETVISAGVAALCLVSGIIVGRCSMSGRRPDIRTETIIRTDTVAVRETVTVERPVYRDRRVTDTMLVAVRDTVVRTDTVLVVLEREQRHYRADSYEAWVSGFRPELDSLSVFPETKYITTETISASPRKRWGIGIQAGYGVGVSGGEVRGVPYVGVGISYNLFQW